MPEVLLAGAYGQGNPGDEALLDAFLDALVDRDVVVATRSPADTAARHGCATVSSTDPVALARLLLDVDAVVIGGGTIFKQLHPLTGRSPHDLLWRATALVRAAKASGSAVALVGVGAAPLPRAFERALSRSIARHADLLILRDDESAALLRSWGLPAPFWVGADPAWTLFRDTRGVRSSNGRAEEVIVALSHYAGDGSLAQQLADSLRPAVREGVRVLLQPWQVTSRDAPDLRLARQVAELLGGASVIDPPTSLLDAASAFGAAGMVVGLRFHALMAAAAAGTPFVAVAHEPKLSAIARTFGQPSVTLARSKDAFPQILRYLASARPPDRDLLRASIAAAREGQRLLRVLLTRGASPEAEQMEGLPLGPRTWPV